MFINLCFVFVFESFTPNFQDDVQKLLEIQRSLIGQFEVIQPGRVSDVVSGRSILCFQVHIYQGCCVGFSAMHHKRDFLLNLYLGQ